MSRGRVLTAAFATALVVAALVPATGGGLAGAQEAPETVLVSIDATGGSANDESRFPAVDATGRYVAFVSDADDIVAGDRNGASDVFVRDTVGATNQLVSEKRNFNGTPGNGPSGGLPGSAPQVDISADANRVVFGSQASDLVSGDGNGVADIFVRDLAAPTPAIVRVNLTAAGDDASASAVNPAISADGSTVAFYSNAALDGASPGLYAVDITDLGSIGAPALVVADPTPGAEDFGPPSVNADGSVVVFDSTLALVGDDTNGVSDVFAVEDGVVERVSVDGGGGQLALPSHAGSNTVSGDGLNVVFDTASPIAADDTNGRLDAYVHSRFTGSTLRASVRTDGTEGSQGALSPAISGDGRTVAFLSKSKLADPDNSASQSVYARDLYVGTTELVSIADDGSVGNNDSDQPALSYDGTAVGFASKSTNLSPGDGNGDADVFLRRRALVPLEPAAIDGLSYTATPTTSPAVGAVHTEDIPISAIPISALATVAATGLRSTDIESTGLRSTGLRSTGLRSTGLRSTGLRSTLLSDLPLELPGGWEALLDGTDLEGSPLQTVTLGDVLDLDPEPAGLRSVTLADVDLAASGLRSTSIVSLALGATGLRSVPLPDEDGDGNPDDWCAFIAEFGYSCADLGIDLDDSDPDNDGSILLLDLAGFPIAEIPFESIGLRSTDLTVAGLRSTGLRSTNILAIGLRSTELSDIDIASTGLRSTELSIIDIASTGLRSTLLSDIDPASGIIVGVCTGCVTLADAQAADAINPDATLLDLVLALPAGADLGTLGELAEGLSEDFVLLTVGELIDATDPSVDLGSLAELIAGLLLGPNFPWADLPLEEMNVAQYARDPQVIFAVDWSTTGETPVGPASVAITPPAGFTYQEGSAMLSLGGGTAANIADPELVDGNLVFEGPLAQTGVSSHLEFAMVPNVDLASYSSQATVTIVGVSGAASATADLETIDPFEDDDTFATASRIEPDVLYFPRIGEEGDVDFYTFEAPPAGSRVTINLSHLGSDYDLAAYTPASSGLRSTGLRSTGLRSTPLEDIAPSGDSEDITITPELLNDVPVSTGLRSTSTQRSTSDEAIVDYAPIGGGDYTIQVTGYNGAFDAVNPYVMQVQTGTPPPPQVCPARTFPFVGTPGTEYVASNSPGTVILFNEERMGATYGAAEAASIRASLEVLADHPAVAGIIVPVETLASTQYADWDASPCNPELANQVALAITDEVQSLKAQHPSIENVVIVGGDDIIPLARVRDDTEVANEASFAGELGVANPISSAQQSRHVLSDDLYGTLEGVPWLDDVLLVPDLYTGRLVEDPDDIVGTVQAFIASNGALDPGALATSLVAGYDFLTDGANAVDAALAPAVDTNETLISETWTREDLIAELFPAGEDSPDIVSANAHYDHRRALPGLGNSTNDESDLFTTDDVEADRLDLKLLFNMGCHAGLPVPDIYLPSGSPLADDWAETLANAVYVANAGFGYGDDAGVALSEELMARFAENVVATDLGPMTVGRAHQLAKQGYFADSGAFGAYDFKVMQQSLLFGLPMFTLGAPAQPAGAAFAAASAEAAAGAVTPTVDPISGLPAVEHTFTPTFTEHTTDDGTYYSVDGQIEVENGRPILPKDGVDVTADGNTAAGAIVIGGLWNPTSNLDAVFATSVVDDSGNEIEVEHQGIFPASQLNLVRSGAPGAETDNLNAILGRFETDPGVTTGSLLLFDELETQVFYTSATDDLVPPLFVTMNSQASTTVQTFDIDVVDHRDEARTQLGDVARVVVTTLDGDGVIRSHDLVEHPGTGHWVGQAPVIGGSTAWWAYAIDDHSNVAVTTNKGLFFAPLSIGDVSDFEIVFTGTPGNTPWYTSGGQVQVVGEADVTYQVSVDGGAYVPASTEPTISDDGVHTVRVLGSDGSGGVTTISIDTTAPEIVITTPPDGAFYDLDEAVSSDFTCTDATSGIVLCDGPAVVDTAAEGVYTFTVDAEDAAGNTATLSHTYTVPFAFNGFFSPVLNPPSVNGEEAGSTVPVKWEVDDGAGGLIDDPAIIQSMISAEVSCTDFGGPRTDIRDELNMRKLITPGGQFVFSWDTRRNWRDTCRVFVLTLDDGIEHVAWFQFT